MFKNEKTIEKTERISGFDSLRFFMVFLVILLHSAMTYMKYPPVWWYVTDDGTSAALAYLAIFLDSFPMQTLFFLAGYFAAPSFDRRGRALFVKEKFIRICVPWLIGVVTIAPFFSYAMLISLMNADVLPLTGALPEPSEFLTKYFFGFLYQQGHYWFLGTLFFFQAAYAVCAFRIAADRKSALRASPPRAVAAVWIASVASYFLSCKYITPASGWVNIGFVICFQPARIVGYAGVFALGVYGWRSGWFAKSGWSPDPFWWGVISLASSVPLIAFKVSMTPERTGSAALVFEALFYNAAAISMTLFLSGLFARGENRLEWLTKPFARDSYGIYWLHMPVLAPTLYVLRRFDISVYIKCALSVLLTLAICSFIVRRVFRRLPLLRGFF